MFREDDPIIIFGFQLKYSAARAFSNQAIKLKNI